jgi:hypothetical protein
MPPVTHVLRRRLQIVLTVLADVDAEVEAWLRQAYEENS